MSIARGLRKVTLATGDAGVASNRSFAMLRFVKGGRLRSGSVPAKWPECLCWFASAMEIDVAASSSSSTVQT